jgi:hypothetical protein
MNHIIFENWIRKINGIFKLQNRKILLLVDNCSSHVTPNNLSNITLKYLPPNSTSKTQLLDQGIISFKSKYRKHFIKHLLSNFDKIDTTKEFIKSINLSHAINWVVSSWDEVTESTIINCYKSSGLKFNIESNNESENDDIQETDDLISKLKETYSEELMSGSEFVAFDNDYNTESDNWKEDLLEKANEIFNSNNSDNTEIISSDEECDIISIPTPEEALTMLEKTESLITKECPDILIHFNKVKNRLIDVKLKLKENRSKQTNITGFFVKY